MTVSVRPRSAVRRSAAAVLALGLGVLTACSGSENAGDGGYGAAPESSVSPPASPEPSGPATSGSASPPAAESQTITATETDFAIALDEDSLAAGSYTIEVVNDGGASHDLVVERDGADVMGTETIAPGGTASLTVDLEPGEYVFYCSVGNHRGMGMEVTVTVT